MPILELKDVRYSYSPEKVVLRGVNCVFECGTLYALVGKSGAGKSTLLSLMAGLDLPESGQVLFEGTPTGDMDLDEYRRRKAAVIYQDFALFPMLTALENIEYPMELCHVDAKEARQQAMELARRVSLPEELLDRYPGLTAHERETAATKEYGTVFLTGIGGKLSNGKPHDGRAPDYDDWSLNGDILFHDDILGESLEISSMGIRVDADSLAAQLKAAGAEERLAYDYHKEVMSGELPLTIGGGIGQSRLCMLLLQKAHIGEVQASLWPDEMKERCEKAGIRLL